MGFWGAIGGFIGGTLGRTNDTNVKKEETEFEKNQKQVKALNELSKRKVVEHNSLITSIAKMDKTPLKMFELAVSCSNTEAPPKDHTV